MNKKSASLNLTGGGGRGYLSICLLENIINLSNMTFREFMSMFSCITGTSIGGIIALALAYGKTLDEIKPLFTKGKRIFTTSPTEDNKRVSFLNKLQGTLLNNAWYKSPSNYSLLPDNQKYGHLVLYDLLDQFFGNSTMANLTKKVVITAFRASNKQFVMFSNYDDRKYFTYNNELIKDVAKATSAAPFYLPSVTIDGKIYQDGGLGVNDPVEMGIILNSVIDTNSRDIFSLNISTGFGLFSFTDQDQEGNSTYLLFQIFDLLGTIMAGSELYANYKLSILNDRLSSSFYTKDNYFKNYRAQPSYVGELDDCSDASMIAMKNLADDYCTRESANIKTFINNLKA
jgi:predicted acylesterase/phospholipase RssA